MDKARHPHVVRTWRVERTRALFHDPKPRNPRETKPAAPAPRKPGPENKKP